MLEGINLRCSPRCGIVFFKWIFPRVLRVRGGKGENLFKHVGFHLISWLNTCRLWSVSGSLPLGLSCHCVVPFSPWREYAWDRSYRFLSLRDLLHNLFFFLDARLGAAAL